MDWETVDPDLAAALASDILRIFMIATAVMVASLAGFGFLLFKAGQLRHPAPLIVSLAMLTAVALVGSLVSGNDNAGNIAAVGFGALAGSLASVYNEGQSGRHQRKKNPPDDTGGMSQGGPDEDTESDG